MKKVFFIGQAPPRTDPGRPFGRTKLYTWLAEIGITNADVSAFFKFGALVDFFPGSRNGSHLLPQPAQIEKFAQTLIRQIRDFDPDVIVPVGKLSIKYCLRLDNKLKLEEYIGSKFKVDAYSSGKHLVVIPFPHPSGASSWVYKAPNRILLKQALKLLQQELK